VFSDTKNALSINWKQVQEKLQSNEIAIDLLAYSYYNKKWTDSIVYAAFVVRKGYKAPKYIPLFEEKQLKYLIVRNSKDDDTIQARILNKQYLDKVISDLFLKPLEKELQGISNIYLSPSGFGNQLDFSAFPVSATQTLGEKYQVHILGSTAEIVNYKTTHLDPKAKLELLLYGNIDYNKSEATSIIVNDTLENKSNINFEGLATRSGITKWNYLIGTKKEVEQIQISGQQNGFSTTIINEGKATEETIKELDGKTTPYLLHLATHGFFFPDPKQELPRENLLSDHKSEIFKTAEDPMMRSGLLFAGANKYWGKPAQNLTSDDGILTASEISNLDLSACQLVVMSACETGLGQINGSEGVFGLQRAFKMAGVKNIIMSLWRVPDAQTAELFDIFYNECLSGKTIHKAFQLAQAKMKIKYPPYYWAGFVLLE
jgi:CHAT domain-containing protein